MARRRSFSRGISDSQRRKKTWVAMKESKSSNNSPGFVTSLPIEVTTPALTGAGSRTVLAAQTGDGTGGDPFHSTLPEESTILRIRGSMLFPKTEFSTIVTTQFNIGFGVKPITGNLSSHFPGPITDSDWDGWMFMRQSGLPPLEAASTIIDIKSMRKLQTGDVFFISAEGVAGAAATATGLWILDLRLLLLLP